MRVCFSGVGRALQLSLHHLAGVVRGGGGGVRGIAG